MTARKDLKDVKHNHSTALRCVRQNFNDAARDNLTALYDGHKIEERLNKFGPTSTDALAKIHEPSRHLSPECAMVNRHLVHSESGSSEA